MNVLCPSRAATRVHYESPDTRLARAVGVPVVQASAHLTSAEILGPSTPADAEATSVNKTPARGGLSRVLGPTEGGGLG